MSIARNEAKPQHCYIAEREGFEPPVPLSTPVFKTGAFDHSAISPIGVRRCSLAMDTTYSCALLICECKGTHFV